MQTAGRHSGTYVSMSEGDTWVKNSRTTCKKGSLLRRIYLSPFFFCPLLFFYSVCFLFCSFSLGFGFNYILYVINIWNCENRAGGEKQKPSTLLTTSHGA